MKILLLHAFPLDKRMWDPQRAALEGHEVIAPRLYGRGKTMDAWAESVAGEIDGEVRSRRRARWAGTAPSHSRGSHRSAYVACCSSVRVRTPTRTSVVLDAPTRSS